MARAQRALQTDGEGGLPVVAAAERRGRPLYGAGLQQRDGVQHRGGGQPRDAELLRHFRAENRFRGVPSKMASSSPTTVAPVASGTSPRAAARSNAWRSGSSPSRARASV